jgi:hypothetical protein
MLNRPLKCYPIRQGGSGSLQKSAFKKLLLLLSFLILNSQFSILKACQCPPTSLTLEECAKYELIFRGRIISTTVCENNKGSAVFEISELYKGASTKTITVHFDCNTPCTLQFNAGEQWIIYTVYKTVSAAHMDWCSRSRRFIKNVKEDFYVMNLGNTYDEEISFLQKSLGVHSVSPERNSQEDHRNELPSRPQMIIYMIIGLGGILLFYYLFKKFVK